MFAQAVNKLLAHYIALAKKTAWKAYAWNRVKDMAKECPELYGELPQLLTAAMTAPTPASNPNTSPP